MPANAEETKTMLKANDTRRHAADFGHFAARIAAGALAAFAIAIPQPAAAQAPSPSAMPTPSFLYGSTPADGCPRFFIQFSLAQLDACADRLADAGWGLSAVTYTYSDGVDHLSGAFEPREPKRWVESDLTETRLESETGFVVDSIGGSNNDHLVTEYQRGRAHACNDIFNIRAQYEPPLKDVPRSFAATMSEEAAAGCVPGSYYSLIRREAIQQEDPDEHVAFVPGDPHTTAATWPRNDAERAAFEKRAAARGFFRLSLSDPPDRWGKTAGPRYVEILRFRSQASGYDALKRRLDLALTRGERVVDLHIDTNDRATGGAMLIAKITFLWERAPGRAVLLRRPFSRVGYCGSGVEPPGSLTRRRETN